MCGATGTKGGAERERPARMARADGAPMKGVGMDGVMTIRLNGREREVARDITVSDLLAELGLSSGMVVVERNREILARDSHPTVRLGEGDRVELVHFVGGG